MIKLVKISEVKTNPNNPRIIKDDKFKKLVKSIQEFPQMLEIRPIVVNKDMIVLGGNMRLKACKEAGLKEIHIIQASDLTEEQEREFIIKDNVGFGEWDWDMLANEWDTIELEDWGLDLLGFDEKETEEPTAEEDDFDVTPPEIPKTVLGDLYEIGEHRLLCGDSTCSDTVAKLMNGEKADMMLTDPPYGMDKKEIKNDSFEFYPTIVKSVMDIFLLHTKENASGYAFGLYPYFVEFHNQLKQYGFNYIQDLYWLKQGSRIIDGRYTNIVENIIFFSKDKEYVFNNILKDIQNYKWLLSEMSIELYAEAKENPSKYKKRFPNANVDNFIKNKVSIKSVFKYSNQPGFKNQTDEIKNIKAEHPTMKPIEMLSDFILQSGLENDLVADPFLGSGSTMVAAHQLNRKCYGMELDPKYCDVIVNRMLKLDDNLKVKRNGIDVTEEYAR